MPKDKIVKCQTCQHEFIMGVNGTVNGCDKCTGVERDLEGHAWNHNETEQLYVPIGGTEKDVFKVTRAQAFGKG
jgi:hypothetical protein